MLKIYAIARKYNLMKKGFDLKKLLFIIWGILICLFFVFPYYWTIISSIVPESELYRTPATYFPNNLSLKWYKIVLGGSFPRNILNSCIVATSTTIICLALGGLCAYALSRLKLNISYIVLGIILAVRMFPAISIASPLYMVFRDLGLTNTYLGLIIPYTSFALPLTVWLMTAYFNTIPTQLEDAAKIDGCSPLKAMTKVILPLSLPGFITAFLLVFVMTWSEFFFALIMTYTDKAQTITVAISQFRGIHEIRWGEMAAGASFVSIPIILLVVIGQKKIVSGLITGAGK